MEDDSCIEPLTLNTQEQDIFHLEDIGRFSDISIVGHGASGLVYEATDTKSRARVAVKKLLFHSLRDRQLGLREIRLMRQLQHDNIVSLSEVLAQDGQPLGHHSELSLKCVFLVQELVDTDLSQLILSKQLSAEHCRFITYQMLRGLKYLHSANVIHRDLKPSNVMVNYTNLSVKIGDYGLARILDSSYDHQGQLTQHIGSCWYRAPEVILTPGSYTQTVDVWAVGCILAEMLLSRPLFAESNDMHQVLKIIDTLHLTESDWGIILCVMPNKLLKNHPLRPRQPLFSSLPNIDPITLNFIEKMLTFDSKSRPLAAEALQDEYLDVYHDDQDEPCALNPFHIEDEVDDLPERTLMQMMIKESQAPRFCKSYIPEPIVHPLSPKETVKSKPKEQTHTLDQILHISPGRVLAASRVESGVEMWPDGDEIMARNLRNVEVPLRQHSPNIFEMHQTVERRKSREKCEDEKDVVEMSAEKIAEDLALTPVEKQVKEQDREEGRADSNRHRPRRHSGSKKKKENEMTAKKKKMASSRKLIMDKIQNEKEQASGRHSQLTDEELDELYRLPTDHLHHDKDYSNQRIREKLKAVPHANDAINELYEGACGGADSLEEQVQWSSEEELCRAIILCCDPNDPIRQHTTLTPQVQEVCSSPEVPSNPQLRQDGARPKKSPNKQRAL